MRCKPTSAARTLLCASWCVLQWCEKIPYHTACRRVCAGRSDRRGWRRAFATTLEGALLVADPLSDDSDCV